MPPGATNRFGGSRLPDGWEKGETLNKIPFYINHKLELTQWDHPVLAHALDGLSSMNSIKFAAYRTAVKVRHLQKTINADLIELRTVDHVFRARVKREEGSEVTVYENSGVIDTSELRGLLEEIVSVTKSVSPFILNHHLDAAVDLILNFILDLFDPQRTGCLKLLSAKVALGLVTSGKLAQKYRFFFGQVSSTPITATPSSILPPSTVSRKSLTSLFGDMAQIPLLIGEGEAFGSLAAAVESCFHAATNGLDGVDSITVEAFLEWMKQEPQTFVWLPTLHRLSSSEEVKHDAKCNGCKTFPIVGFRYKCLKCFSVDFCQECFFTGRSTKRHKASHPMQEYCSVTTTMADTKAFAKTLRNRITKGYKRKPPKLRYLPVEGEGTNKENEVEEAERVREFIREALKGKKEGDAGKKQKRPIPRQPNFEDLSDDDVDAPSSWRKGKRGVGDAQESADEGVEDDGEFDDRYEALPPARRDVGVGRTLLADTDEEEGAYVLPNGGNIWNEKHKAEMESIIMHLEGENINLMTEIEKMHHFANDSATDSFVARSTLERRRKSNVSAMSAAMSVSSRNPSLAPSNCSSTRLSKDNAFKKRLNKEKLEAKLEILESHNRQLETQLTRLRRLFQQTLKADSGDNGIRSSPPPLPARLPSHPDVIHLPPPPLPSTLPRITPRPSSSSSSSCSNNAAAEKQRRLVAEARTVPTPAPTTSNFGGGMTAALTPISVIGNCLPRPNRARDISGERRGRGCMSSPDADDEDDEGVGPAESTRISSAKALSPRSIDRIDSRVYRLPTPPTDGLFSMKISGPEGNSTRDSMETLEMSKSCWSLPTDDGSAGEDAAALQAILNGYMAAVPMRIAEHAENFAESSPVKESRQRNLISAARRVSDVMGGFVERIAPPDHRKPEAVRSGENEPEGERCGSELGNPFLTRCNSASVVPPLLLPAEDRSRTSSSSGSSLRRSSSGFSEHHLNASNNSHIIGNNLNGSRECEDMRATGAIQKPFSLNSFGGISCLSLDASITHDATFDESFTD